MLAIILLCLLAMLIGGVYVGASLGFVAYSLGKAFAFFPVTNAFGQIAWSVSHNFILVAAPLFILMGQLLLTSGISDRMYMALEPWLSRLPGGLMHTNIAASALFASTSGSSAATAATIGTLAIPNIERGGYHTPTFLGSLAAGGTLGILIPPSVNMIVYGFMAEVSVPQLYLAGIIPGLLLVFLFSMTIIILCLINPTWGGIRRTRTALVHMIQNLIYLLPPLGLFVIVVGSIYMGIATPTEAAALGVVAALGLAYANRKLTMPVLKAALLRTMQTICMIKFIVLTAFLLNFVMTSTGITQALVKTIIDIGLSPLGMILAICAGYILLGCFLETMAMMIATVPVVVPVIVAFGYDPIWFGVLLMLLMETGMITPPVGINLFVIHSVRGEGKIQDVIIGTLPFILTMFVMIVLLISLPDVALWLPNWWSSL